MTFKRNNNSKYGYEQQQLLEQQQTAYQAQVTRDLFRSAIKWLEKYIEVGGYYSDWENRKQIRADEIKRTDIAGNPEKVKKFLATALLGFEGDTDNPELLGELKEQYYKWISAVRIDPQNCPEDLKHFLVGFHEILEGRGEKINKDAENRTFEIDPSSQEYADRFAQSFIGVQIPLQKERKKEEFLTGKNWREIESENNFEGNIEQGKRIFEQIARNHNYRDFHFWPQKSQQVRNLNYNPLIDDPSEEFISSSSQTSSIQRIDDFQQARRFLIGDIKKHANEFEFQTILTFTGQYWDNINKKWVGYGKEKQETILVHKSVKITENDYNEHGYLNIKTDKMFQENRFNQREWAEIQSALKVNDIKQNSKLEKGLVVFNQETDEYYEADDWFIHNSLERKTDDKTGCLIYDPNGMIRVKDLTEAEKAELGLLQTQTTSYSSSGGSGWGFGSSNLHITIAGSTAIISLIGLIHYSLSLECFREKGSHSVPF